MLEIRAREVLLMERWGYMIFKDSGIKYGNVSFAVSQR
jgi:hypothetical protein